MSAPAESLQVQPTEEVDAVVVHGPRPLPARRTGQSVAASAAVAATSFAVGAATAVVVANRRSRRAGRRTLAGRRGRADIVASRSFLVDVHLLNGR
jgi:hypothetical protein